MAKGNWSEFHDPRSIKNIKSEKSNKPTTTQKIRVQKIKAGKRGKIITLITGLRLDDLQSKSLLKELKASVGTGGTLKGEDLELQGDQVTKTLEILNRKGYQAKKSGG